MAQKDEELKKLVELFLLEILWRASSQGSSRNGAGL